MKNFGIIFYSAVAGILTAAAAPWIGHRGEASAAWSGDYRAELLFTTAPERPLLDRIAELDYAVIASYPVTQRDSLWEFCKRFKLDAYSIRSSNNLDIQILEPGTLLKVPNRKGTLYEVVQAETLRTISQGYARGRTLGAAYERDILEQNGYPAPDFDHSDLAFRPGTQLFLPGAFKPTGLGLPFLDMKFRQTSRYGNRRHPVTGGHRSHKGLDLAKPYGSPVLTAREGIVTFAGWSGGYGMMVEVKHVIKRANGTRVLHTRYGHLSQILVNPGQKVRLYQMIGRVGSTGLSTGPHLHFEVRDDSGLARNPANFL